MNLIFKSLSSNIISNTLEVHSFENNYFLFRNYHMLLENDTNYHLTYY